MEQTRQLPEISILLYVYFLDLSVWNVFDIFCRVINIFVFVYIDKDFDRHICLYLCISVSTDEDFDPYICLYQCIFVFIDEDFNQYIFLYLCISVSTDTDFNQYIC